MCNKNWDGIIQLVSKSSLGSTPHLDTLINHLHLAIVIVSVAWYKVCFIKCASVNSTFGSITSYVRQMLVVDRKNFSLSQSGQNTGLH